MKEGVLDAISFMLRPVLRICLRHSIKLNEVIELVKATFIEVAAADLKKGEEEISVSKLSVMTGVHRKDATRIYKRHEVRKRADNLISKILGQWQTHPDFTTSSGTPKVLTAEGVESEFFRLVKSVSGDLNPYTVLYELKRSGIVKESGKKVKLVATSQVVEKDIVQGLLLAAEDLDDMTAGVEENLYQELPIPNLHLKTEYDRIVPEAVGKIKQWIIDEGESFHKRARKFLAQFDTDSNPNLCGKKGNIRIVVGTFSRVGELD